MLPHHRLRGHLQARFASFGIEHPGYRWWALSATMVGTFMAVLDATIVNVALAKIMASFGVPVDKVEWVATAYLLAFAVMLPTSSWIARRLGHKRTYLFAQIAFTVASGLCGFAWSEDALIAFRVLQGAAAGAIIPVGMTIVSEIFPPERRGQALGIWGIAGGSSAAIGPTIGGYLVEYVGWRSVFYVNLPVGVVGAAMTLVLLRELPSRRAGRFDAVGFAAMALGLGSLLLALAQGQSKGWESAYIRVCEALAVAGLVAFIWWEIGRSEPLVDLSLFRNAGFALINLLAFIFGLGMFGSTFLLPIFLQNMLGYPALQAGLTLLPAGVAMGITAPVAGRLSDRMGGRSLAFLGLCLMCLSMYLNSRISLFTSRTTIYGWLVLRGIGMGLLFSPMTSLALGLVPRAKAGQASGLLNVIRQLGGSFGIALFGTLLVRRQLFHLVRYSETLTAQSFPATTALQQIQAHFLSRGDTASVASQKGLAVLGLIAQQQAGAAAFSDCFLVAVWICAAGLVPTLLLPRRQGFGAAVHDPTAPDASTGGSARPLVDIG